MKNRSTIIAGILAAVLSFCFIDPFRIVSGKFDSNPYTEIQNELNKPTTTGVLVLASYNDLYNFPVYRYLRDILGTRLAYHGEISVENGYDEALTQASLGEESFLQYLKSVNISHLIVPGSTADSGEVFHRWSTHGTVNIDLNSDNFSLVQKSGDSFPLALYSIDFSGVTKPLEIPPSYFLDWDGVRADFYKLLRIIDEGYNVRYLRKYEERIDTAWIFEGEQARITLRSPDTPDQKFSVELQFVAAYGDNAPPQVLRLTAPSVNIAIELKAGEVSVYRFDLHNGESINIENVFGCPQGVSFDLEGQDIREFCYGLRDVKVRVTN